MGWVGGCFTHACMYIENKEADTRYLTRPHSLSLELADSASPASLLA